MIYLFPATIFSESNTSGEQIDHFLTEVDEIEAIGPVLEDSAGDPAAHAATSRMLDLEIVDAIHSLETWRRIRVKELGQEYVDELIRETVAKNSAPGRDYYL